MTHLSEFAKNAKATLQSYTPKEQYFNYLALQGQYALPCEEETGLCGQRWAQYRKFLAVH